MTSPSKSVPLAEVEALLAAERERCAKVAEDPAKWWDYLDTSRGTHHAIAAAIRSLSPQMIGDEG